jgi:catechol 2,3-dioxygenase-like lactoylglutathione lyase family enzyme
MKPRITVITLGVSDLEKSLLFYRDGLGTVTCGKWSGTQDLKLKLLTNFLFFILVFFIGMASRK